MTIKEALLSTVEIKFSTGAVNVERILIDRDLNGDDEYTKADSLKVDLSAVDVLMTLFGLSSFSEGDMSISYDRDGIKTRLLFLAKKHGLTSVLDAVNPRPVVTAVRNKW